MVHGPIDITKVEISQKYFTGFFLYLFDLNILDID